MRKSILLSLLCLVAIFAVACGGGNNSTNKGNGGTADGGSADGGGSEADPVAQWEALYTKGRVWVTKTSMKEPKMVTHMKTEVLDVNDKEATIKTWMLDADKKPMMGMEAGNESKVPKPAKAGEPVADASTAPKPKMSDETLKVEAGEFSCTKIENDNPKSTVWMDKKTGAMVKMTTDTMEMELVEFK